VLYNSNLFFFRGQNGFIVNTGEVGVDGRKGKDGQVKYEIMNEKGEVIEESNTGIYNIHQSKFSLQASPSCDDGVLEPGELLVFAEAIIQNTGSLTSPDGIVFKVEGNKHLNTSSTIKIPPIPPKKSISQPLTALKAKIDKDAIPLGKKNAMVTVSASCSLDGKLFPDSVVTTEFEVRYPIEMEIVSVPQKMGRSEVEELVFELTNISQIPYGDPTGPTAPDLPEINFRGGSISVRVLLGSSLLAQENYTNRMDKKIEFITPNGGTYRVNVPILMGYEGEFYDRHKWTVELYLRDKLIDSQTGFIEAIPCFNANMMDEDVLLILCSSPSRDLFSTFRKTFDALGLYNINYWDAGHYRGVSYNRDTKTRHAQTWVDRYRGKLIIVYSEKLDHALELISAADITSHFENAEESSGMLFITEDMSNIKSEIADYLLKNGTSLDDKYKVRELSDLEFVDYFRFGTPTLLTMTKKCRDIENESCKNDKQHRYRLIVEREELTQVASSWVSLQRVYTYGTASMYRIPITINQHLTGTEIKHDTFVSMDVTDVATATPSSPMFKLLYTVIANLSIKKKLTMFVNDIMTKVVAETIYFDIKREFFRTTEDGFYRLRILLSECESHYDARQVVNQVLMLLHRLETDSYWSSWLNSEVREKRNRLVELRTQFEDEVRVNAMSYDGDKIVSRAVLNYKAHQMNIPDQTKLFRYLIE
jgi:hypothetical protein